jgi:hypothetical protein
MTNLRTRDADSAGSHRRRDRATGLLVLLFLLVAGVWMGIKLRHAASDTPPASQVTN